MLTELAAVRYALISRPTLVQPKRVVMERLQPVLRPVSVSVRTGAAVLSVAHELAEQAQAADPVSRIALTCQQSDCETVAEAMTTICDEGYDPDQAIERWREIARKAMAERFRFPFTAKPHVVLRNFAAPYDRVDLIAYSGRDGIFLKRDQLFPGVTELIVLRENVHSAIRGPGYVPWFDESVANLLSYLLYCEQTGDFSAIQHYRTYLRELSPTLGWYPEFDRLLATLVLLGWQNLLFALIGARLRDPGGVDWDALPQLISRGRPLEEARDKCFPDLAIGNCEFFGDRLVQRVLATILAPNSYLTLTPAAHAILTRALREGDLPVGGTRSDLALENETFEAVLQELAEADLLVSSRGRLTPVPGADRLVAAGMVRVAF